MYVSLHIICNMYASGSQRYDLQPLSRSTQSLVFLWSRSLIAFFLQIFIGLTFSITLHYIMMMMTMTTTTMMMMMIKSVESVRLLVILADLLGSIIKRVVCRCILLGLDIGPFSLLDYVVH